MSKLKEVRVAKGLSQNDLVRLSGVSRSVITKYESGEKDIRKANVTTLLKLASILRCRVEDLVDGSEDIMQEGLNALYKEWRREIEEHNKWEEEHGGSIPTYQSYDCGQDYVREDFSNYAELEEEINFEDMLKLEENYEA